MIVLQHDAFHSAALDTEIIALFALTVAGRHRIRIATSARTMYERWLQSQSDGVKEQCKFALDQSAQSESTEPSMLRVMVTDKTSSEASSPPQLSASDAMNFLHRPICVLVENRRADKAFLLKMARKRFRQKIARWESRGWLSFEHGGGIDEMRKRVEELTGDALESMRHWVLFDSDALTPGVPSSSAKALTEACDGAIAHHQLARRAIENYLPKAALRSWAYDHSNRVNRDNRARVLEAYLELSDLHARHFNMKAGLLGDARRQDGESATGFWDSVPAPTKRALANGFGNTIGRIYQDEPVELRDEWIEKEGLFDEMASAIAQLVGLLR